MATASATFPGGGFNPTQEHHPILDMIVRFSLVVFFWFGYPILAAYSYVINVDPMFYWLSALVYVVAYAAAYAIFGLHPFMNHWNGATVKKVVKTVSTVAPTPASTAKAKPDSEYAPKPNPASAEKGVSASFNVEQDPSGKVKGGLVTEPEPIVTEITDMSDMSAFELGARAQRALDSISLNLERVKEILSSRKDCAANLHELFELMGHYQKVKADIEAAKAAFEAGVKAGYDLPALLTTVEKIEALDAEVTVLVGKIAKALEATPTTVSSTAASTSAVSSTFGIEEDPARLEKRIGEIRELAKAIGELDHLSEQFPRPCEEAIEISEQVAEANSSLENAEKAIREGQLRIVLAAEAKDPKTAKHLIRDVHAAVETTGTHFGEAEESVVRINELIAGGAVAADLEEAKHTIANLENQLEAKDEELEGVQSENAILASRLDALKSRPAPAASAPTAPAKSAAPAAAAPTAPAKSAAPAAAAPAAPAVSRTTRQPGTRRKLPVAPLPSSQTDLDPDDDDDEEGRN